MYEAYFGLHQRPFTVAPEADRYFAATASESARMSLARAIERAEGIGLLIGATGIGKTLLCRVLATQFRDRFQVAMLASGRLGTRRALLQAILFELNLPYRGMEEGELRLSLIDHLSPRGAAHNAAADVGLVLIVDEAHTLPSKLLEELRMITNLVRDGLPRVRLVLAGGPQLEERFSSPKLESFNQRVVARCYLTALNKDETDQFVRSAIESSGGVASELFTESALAAIYEASEGIPRLVNQICDHALILACAGNVQPIERAGIDEAWADLQQLPAPWTQNRSGTSAATSSVIEFGGLSDEPSAVLFRSDYANQAVEPAEQVDAIQQQLEGIDDEFEPAGSIGPQVELYFAEESNPFNEMFLEEEVIVDHYAMLDSGLLQNLPVVRSREGTELAGLLAPFVQPQPKPRLSISAPTSATSVPAQRQPAPMAKSGPSASHVLPAVAEQSSHRVAAKAAATVPSQAPTVSEQPAPIVIAPRQPSTVEQLPAKNISPPKPVAAPSDDSQDDEVHHIQDHDLIVIESDPVENLDAERHPVRMQRQVRRQEYRQLFARLRRG